MSVFDVVAILITLAALFAYLNYRFIHLPSIIGVMSIALIASLALIGVSELAPFGTQVRDHASRLLASIDFEKVLMQGMLAFLLFAGALHIDLSELGKQKGAVTLLSTVGTAASTFIVGGLTWLLLRAFHLELRLMDCLLFGALISPTDPIAVLGILKTAGAPKSLETKIAGESLFNDGIGVVIFVVMLQVARGGADVTAAHIGRLLLEEAVGGVAYGLVAGVIAYQMLKRVNNYQVEVLITLALVAGGYALADHLPIHVSGPIAMVVAGLLIGNQGRAFAMSRETREHLDTFWELVDEILNAVLFVLIGLQVLVMPFTRTYLMAGLAVIPVALFARWLSVAGSVGIMRTLRPFTTGAVSIMTWAGLRGGISVALALSLPTNLPAPSGHAPRDVILAMTYAVVVFSIIGQGLTVGPLVRRKLRAAQQGTTHDVATAPAAE